MTTLYLKLIFIDLFLLLWMHNMQVKITKFAFMKQFSDTIIYYYLVLAYSIKMIFLDHF